MNLTGAVLCRDRIDRFRSMGAFGKPAYQSHVQLRALLLAQRKPQLANYFAKPVYDADAGEMLWTAELPGTARRRSELSPEEQTRGDAALAQIRAGLLDVIDKLRHNGATAPGGGAAFASLLEQAMKVPAQGDHVYFVGEQPVLAFWGFEDETGASADPAAPAPPTVVETPPVDTTAPVAVEPAPKKEKWRWWWWLLLALLLLLLLLFAWRACSETVPGAPGTPERKAGQPLSIPPGALERGDLSFLKGQWQLGDDRLIEYRDTPGNVIGSGRNVLDFGTEGTGTGSMAERRRHGAGTTAGAPFPDCSGALRARTDGKKLYFEQAPCEVPGRPGMGFNSSKHECVRSPDGRTTCYNLNDDGHRWEAPLRRLE